MNKIMNIILLIFYQKQNSQLNPTILNLLRRFGLFIYYHSLTQF